MTEARSNRATCQEKQMTLEVAYSQTLCFLFQGLSSARMEINTAENLLKSIAKWWGWEIRKFSRALACSSICEKKKKTTSVHRLR